MIEFEWPWALALLPVPFLLRALLPVAPERRTGALRVPLLGAFPLATDGGRGKRLRRVLMLGVLALAWGALTLAAARPSLLGTPTELPARGRDLMMAIDLSGSMAQRDFTLGGESTDRLTVVKQVAHDFVERREGDRVGLVFFGTRAYLQSPLSYDRGTVASLLDEAAIGLTGEETAIGDAIGTGVRRLRERPAESRVLVLLTDGSSNAGALEPLEAAKIAADEGVRIHTIGVGADAMAVQDFFGQRIVNPAADLDEETLARIAEATGGSFFRARNAEGLAEIYRQIDQLEPTDAEPRYVQPRRELFAWPLALAFLTSLGIGAAEVLPRPRASAPLDRPEVSA